MAQYAFTRHPAYISKNLSWWVGAMPFLVTAGGWVEGARNVILLGLVSGVYYWRAKTEEKHLLADPAYRRLLELGAGKCARAALLREAHRTETSADPA